MNNVQLIGRLTKDPEVRGSQDRPVANFNLAIDRPKRQDGTQETDFPRIVCFGKTAETAEKYLRKGARAGITGRIQTGSYTNQAGDKVYTTDVICDRLDIIDWPDRDGGGAYDQAQAGAAQRQAPEDAPFWATIRSIRTISERSKG